MSILLPDNFDEFPGQLINYDTPFGFSSTSLNTILTNQHIDLRTFSQGGVYRLRTQADLDNLTQSILDTQTQTQLEQIQIIAGENWLSTGSPTGTNGVISVGPILQFDNWSGLRHQLSGSALSVTYQSSIPILQGGAINIASQDSLSVVFPEFNNFNTTTSTIQLCSNDTGDFTSNNSPAIAFSASTTSGAERRFALSNFTGVDLTRVTGVKIHLVSASNPTAGSFLTVMGLRAIKNTWSPMALDLDTKRGVITSSPTLTGSDPSAAQAWVPMIRGVTGGTSDPRPIDTTLTMAVFTGSLTISNTSTGYNRVQLIFRENRTSTDGSYIVGELDFRNGSTVVKSFAAITAGSIINGSTITYSNLPILSPNSYYIFQADLTNQSLTMNIFTSDVNGTFGNKIWSSKSQGTGTNPNYLRQQGRVGWSANFVDRDVALYNFGVSTTAFSTIRTKVLATYTPVDGAQLIASFSEDTNLWSGWAGANVQFDSTKSISGLGSYVTTYPIFSNEFLVSDWSQMYIRYNIWVPSQMTATNQPYAVIRSNDTLQTTNLTKTPLQPNQWNQVEIDLDQLQGIITGVFYQLWIESGQSIQTPYSWWVDTPVIGRRNVSWQLRANTASGVWREFRDMVNNEEGALHLPPAERGSELQLQAIGLTEDAWVAGFTLKPRYASLGKPVYY